MSANPQLTVNAILREDLASFIHRTFAELSPGTAYRDNWHIRAIAWHLTRCYWRDIKRLIITLPPRNLKSISASVAFPAWALGQDPTLRFICVSYADALSNKHASDTRRVMESPFYRQCFPNTRTEKATQSVIVTSANGGRVTTTVNGSLTGLGGNFIIVDDIHKADEITSDTKREAAIEFFTNTLLSRLDNKQQDVIIVIQQRLHEYDLVGHLLEAGGWEHLNLPAIAEEPQQVAVGPNLFHTRQAGDVLHPEHESLPVLKQIEADMGPLKFAAQYQQRPAPLGGGILKWAWFQTYDDPPNPDCGGYVAQAWDTAYTIEKTSDWTVCTTWYVFPHRAYLVDVFREKLDFVAVEKAIYMQAERWKTNVVVIEAVSTGMALFQRLWFAGKLNITSDKPQRAKAERIIDESHAIYRGEIFIPRQADWLEGFRREILNFPNGKHDDQVDSLSLFLRARRCHFRGARPSPGKRY